MTTVIKVENLSKQYRLGVIGSSTIREDLQRVWYRMRGLGDPFAKVGKASNLKSSPNREIIMALDDVSFQVKQGEILGIIGRNGAGKSTLLKILSRVTAPSSGKIKVKGRIASLLEVGTGFHPELTGRENVFLNGAILGMTRAEVARKFDEIVDFAEISRFIDTPVKRYSSGMYVRLAFAVAAHLEPEILIVDEVLAVGDASFQKKCIGKMGDVSKGGRTVLFVSHSMPTISTLCTRGLLIRSGQLALDGKTEDVVSEYISSNTTGKGSRIWEHDDANIRGKNLRLIGMRSLCDGKVAADVRIDQPITVEVDYEVEKAGPDVTTSIQVFDKMGVMAFSTMPLSHKLAVGKYRRSFKIPANLLNEGVYSLSVLLITDQLRYDVHVENALSIHVHDVIQRSDFLGYVMGCVRPIIETTHESLAV